MSSVVNCNAGILPSLTCLRLVPLMPMMISVWMLPPSAVKVCSSSPNASVASSPGTVVSWPLSCEVLLLLYKRCELCCRVISVRKGETYGKYIRMELIRALGSGERSVKREESGSEKDQRKGMGNLLSRFKSFTLSTLYTSQFTWCK